MPRLGVGLAAFVTQKPIDYIDTTLVINTWETVSADLSAGAPAKLWYIIIEQTNNGATAEDIELEITINGTAYTFTASLDSGVTNYGTITQDLATGDFTPALGTTLQPVCSLDADQSVPFVAEKVGLIRVRQTSTVDAVSAQIEVNIVWEKRQVR